MSERSEFGQDPVWSSDGDREAHTELNDVDGFEKSRILSIFFSKPVLPDYISSERSNVCVVEAEKYSFGHRSHQIVYIIPTMRVMSGK